MNYKEVQENADKLEKVRKQILKLVDNTYLFDLWNFIKLSVYLLIDSYENYLWMYYIF